MNAVLKEEPEPLPDEVPSALADVIRTGLTKDPAARPNRAGKLLEILDGATAPAVTGPRTNLEPAERPVVGREGDIFEIRRLLLDEGARLVTVTGPPGIGKSALVREAARGLTGDFPSGVWLVNAAEGEVRDTVLGLLPAKPEDLRSDALVVLDRAGEETERILAALSAWIHGAARLHFLVASRSPLHLEGEVRRALTGLDDEGVVALLGSLDTEWPPEKREAAAKLLLGYPLGIEAAVRAGGDLEAARLTLHERVVEWLADLDDHERRAMAWAREQPEGFTLFDAEDGIELPEDDDAPFVFDVIQSLSDRGLLTIDHDAEETLFRAVPLP
jgi:hypothetical protein